MADPIDEAMRKLLEEGGGGETEGPDTLANKVVRYQGRLW
ncbi:hypothetical protein LCGC14_2315140, partial [marine sediment metagenome]